MKLSCKEATRLMSEAHERELGTAERLALRAHVALCRGCAAVEKQFATLREAMRRVRGGDGD